MNITKKIKLLLVENEMTATQLAEKIGTTQSNLSKKMKNESYTVSDLEKIAEVLNMELIIEFKSKI
ncbi:helix-turn-helix transcriptional regulator [Lysinibacillus capsici]|uniref:helix-turn-helix domain-containing protein n=1 Tax=Lysinibacillus capsici TaxID=2115968 RepID=UPI0029DE52F0|nr:helix-turn-helix transcriptional regulator [Lysinibacillus capsici]WPK04270.1 helix-turn-helix transcriptional regulator [Lysinibacillus capsici]